MVQPVGMNVTTLYYVRTERPVTMQNHGVINVKVANAAAGTLHDDLICGSRCLYFRRLQRDDANFYIAAALIGASEIDESSSRRAYQRIRAGPLFRSRVFFASRRTTTTTTRSHFICASGALFLISPRVIRVAAVLQFIRRRWQRQPPAGNSGLIKFTDAPSAPPAPALLLRHGTVSVSLRLRPSRFILAKRQSA